MNFNTSLNNMYIWSLNAEKHTINLIKEFFLNISLGYWAIFARDVLLVFTDN